MYHKKSHNNYIYEGLAREPYRTLPSLSSMASSSSKRAVVVLDLVWLCLALSHIILVKGREVPSHEPGRKNHVLNKGIDLVQRPSKRELSEKESYMSFGEPDPANFQPNDDTLQRTAHFAVIKSKGGTYFGTRAKINIWQPQVKNGQSSTAAIWVSNGLDSPENYNKIVVGWHVAPELYGDTKTHFFTHWQGATGTVFNGCYNVECPGFVLTSPDPLIPGAILDKTSTVDGKQYYLPLQIAQDRETGDWWLYTNAQPIGHWPKSLFTSLANGASNIDWGGVITYFKNNGTSPPMGSGEFPSELQGKEASFKDIQYVDSTGNFSASSITDFHSYSDSLCYNVSEPLKEGGSPAFSFYFGGPGGCNT